jgi:hypothetical protein
MRHHQVKPNTTHQITSRYQTVTQFTIKPKHIYKTIGYETSSGLTTNNLHALVTICAACPVHLIPLTSPVQLHFVKVQIMKLLIMRLSPTSCHFILPWSKYSPQLPQSMFLLQHQRPSFGIKQSYKQIRRKDKRFWTK